MEFLYRFPKNFQYGIHMGKNICKYVLEFRKIFVHFAGKLLGPPIELPIPTWNSLWKRQILGWVELQLDFRTTIPIWLLEPQWPVRSPLIHTYKLIIRYHLKQRMVALISWRFPWSKSRESSSKKIIHEIEQHSIQSRS